MKDMYFRLQARAFSGHGIENILAMVTYDDGKYVVRVYDDLAEMFTKCHSLSKNATQKILKASKLVIKNNLSLVSNSDGHFRPEEIIDGYR